MAGESSGFLGDLFSQLMSNSNPLDEKPEWGDMTGGQKLGSVLGKFSVGVDSPNFSAGFNTPTQQQLSQNAMLHQMLAQYMRGNRSSNKGAQIITPDGKFPGSAKVMSYGPSGMMPLSQGMI